MLTWLLLVSMALAADSDGDGLDDYDEDPDGDGNLAEHDWDGDGVPDYLDDDDDNDGFPTSVEAPSGVPTDFDNDGTPDHLDLDSDNDTVPDSLELSGDTDGDGDPDRLDVDDDNDSINTAEEGTTANSDGDGLPNYLDDDDDNDGIPTIKEANEACGGADFDGDGSPNYVDLDSDADGHSDADESSSPMADSDGDGCDDYLDLDSDGDGVPDSSETLGDSDADGVPNRADDDDDGDSLPTRDEEPLSPDGNPGNDDSDGDGTPNYLDPDDDNDSVPTLFEVTQSVDSDRPTGGTSSPVDWDGDGLPDYLDVDDDNDSVLTIDETAGGTSTAVVADFDQDCIPDRLDVDDDNDQILTIRELPPTVTTAQFDGDGWSNHLDVDSDGDGWADCEEAYGWLNPICDYVSPADPTNCSAQPLAAHENSLSGYHIAIDTDGPQGIFDGPDFLDLDSDNDEVSDLDELHEDYDGDGLVNRVDTDDDGDQVPTEAEEYNSDGSINNVAVDPQSADWDGDGTPNFLDFDDDNDSVDTIDEDVDGSGTPYDDNTDSVLANPDSLPDFLDSDDDGDGLLTIDEAEDPSGSPLQRDPRLFNTDEEYEVAEGRPLRPNYLDQDDDGDGINTEDETAAYFSALPVVPPYGLGGSTDPTTLDFPDGDGIPNYLDEDDDNDGVDTYCEFFMGAKFLNVDTDGDFVPDGEEWFNFLAGERLATIQVAHPTAYPTEICDLGAGCVTDPTDPTFDLNFAPLAEGGRSTGIDDGRPGRQPGCIDPWDRDGDSTPNAFDSDDDGDGMATFVVEDDFDVDCFGEGDGIPGYLDFDSDNDGVSDADETSNGTAFDDSDGDGLLEHLDCDNNGCSGDSDLDGVLNCDEAVLCAEMGRDINNPSESCALDADVDADGVIDGVEYAADLDGDGVLDAYEFSLGPLDSDGDGVPDFADEDDDNDGVLTREEAGITCPADTVMKAQFSADFGYHIFVCFQEGLPVDSFDLGGTTIDWYPNTDQDVGAALPCFPDTVPDYLDNDDDGDGVATCVGDACGANTEGLPEALDGSIPDCLGTKVVPETGQTGHTGVPTETDTDPTYTSTWSTDGPTDEPSAVDSKKAAPKQWFCAQGPMGATPLVLPLLMLLGRRRTTS